MAKAKECVDHKGIKYKSFSAMCKAYNKRDSLVRDRLENGMSIEEALTTPVKEKCKECVDPNGRVHKSFVAMCKAYDISHITVRHRMRRFGYSLEEALTTPVREVKVYVDPNGRVHKSFYAMCKAYDKDVATVKIRMNKGMRLEEALTKPVRKHTKPKECKECVDPDGRTHKTFKDMCKAYDMDACTVRFRMNKGMSLEEALTKPIHNYNEPKECVDPDGRTHKTFKDMCKAYGMDDGTVKTRMDKGMSLEEALTTPMKIAKEYVDLDGKVYSPLANLCKVYDKSVCTVISRLNNNVELFVALICKRVKLEFIGLDGKAYYKLAGIEELFTTRQIIEKYRPDLVPKYDEQNPDGKYMPPNEEQ